MLLTTNGYRLKAKRQQAVDGTHLSETTGSLSPRHSVCSMCRDHRSLDRTSVIRTTTRWIYNNRSKLWGHTLPANEQLTEVKREKARLIMYLSFYRVGNTTVSSLWIKVLRFPGFVDGVPQGAVFGPARFITGSNLNYSS